jgi:hypothetical protein
MVADDSTGEGSLLGGARLGEITVGVMVMAGT